MSLIITPRTTLSTFARASAATYINPNGRITASASGAMRTNHNPVTGAAKGVLMEPARTNQVIGSADIGGTGWTNLNITANLDNSVALDGTTERTKIVPNATVSGHYAQRSITLGAASQECFSVYCEPAGYEWIAFVIISPGMTNVDIRFNMTTGAFTLSGGTATYGAEKVRDGTTDEWRFWVSYLTVTGGASTHRVYCGNNSGGFTFAGDTTSGISVWGAQQETGKHPTSYIPTTTAAVARVADDLTLLVATWLNAAEGTLFVECDWPYGSTEDIGNRVAIQIDDGTNNNRIRIDNGGGLRGAVKVNSGGILEASIAGAAASTNVTRVAFAWRSAEFASSIDGAAVTELLTGAIPIGLTTARVGSGLSAVDRLSGSVRWWYYPKRLSNAALIEMTT
jgi:hypothetical protein